MMMFPADLWPAGLLPEGLTPDDASRYEVLRHADGQLLAAVLPGSSSAVVTGPSGSTAEVFVRVFNRVNLPDHDNELFDLRRIAFDDQGDLLQPAPAPPRNLQLTPGPGGRITATWQHRGATFGGLPAPAEFRVYTAVAPASIDYAAAGLTVAAPPYAGSTSADLGTFAHGSQVRVVVRAATAAELGGVEDTNTDEAVAIADATAPATAVVTRLEVVAG